MGRRPGVQGRERAGIYAGCGWRVDDDAGGHVTEVPGDGRGSAEADYGRGEAGQKRYYAVAKTR